ncbi:hypothetical protein O181_048617 [Austropuccinia psidii MF-1]|uniref:Transcription factor CBF/NF-Y/archaeal histone domain-containing protein n=1 Tax=Austropuccinia psidii MF-1 TaxID=1389203 RepID=A0A9Q3HLT1_9BASI|nr:hypothetical protein [Austropuccinia psidii MF-1]
MDSALFPTDPSLSVIAPHPQATVSTTPATSSARPAPIKDAELDTFNPQHLLLPLSNVAKLMKASLPPDAKISNASKVLVQCCVSEFAVRQLGFEGYYDALKIYLAKYRTVAIETGKRQRRHRPDDDQSDVEDIKPSKRRRLERPEFSISPIEEEEFEQEHDEEIVQEDDEL